MRDEQTFDVHPTKQPNPILSLIFLERWIQSNIIESNKVHQKDGQSNWYYSLFDISNGYQSYL